MTIIEYAATQDINLTREEAVIYDTQAHNFLHKVAGMRVELVEVEYKGSTLYIHEFRYDNEAEDPFLVQDYFKQVLGI